MISILPFPFTNLTACHFTNLALLGSIEVLSYSIYISDFFRCLTVLSFIHAVPNGRISFFFMWLNNILIYVCMWHLYSSIPWWALRLFPYMSAIMNRIIMNTRVQISFRSYFYFLLIVSRSGVVGSCDFSIFSFIECF